MFVIDKNYIADINKEIPLEIRRDFHVKTKITLEQIPPFINVSKLNRYIEVGVGFETLIIQTYVVYAEEEYVGLLLNDKNEISMQEHLVCYDCINLSDIFGDLPDKATRVDVLYDDSKKNTINKLAFIFTLTPTDVPENITFFIKNQLLKDINKGNFKDTGWVTQYME